MLFYDKIISRQFLYFVQHLFHQILPICRQIFGLVFDILKLIRNIKLQIKNRPLKCQHISSRLAFVHTEKFKVSAKIKDIKLLLILSIYQAFAKSRSPADHLPELCFTHHLFKKN